VEDVARAFDTILHKGLIGHIYNIGGSNEFSNIEVAKKLLTLMGKVGEDGVEAAVAEHVKFVPDRPFNDVHYHLDSSKLAKLGWLEEVSWDEGLRRTLEWYRVNSGNWGDLSAALVAHPRRGLTASELYLAAHHEGGGGSGASAVGSPHSVHSAASGVASPPTGH
jgi:UDP-glucose 4,6-dehydratase